MEQLHFELVQKKRVLVGYQWTFAGSVREAIARATKHYLERDNTRFIEVRMNPGDFEKAQVQDDERLWLIPDRTVLPQHIYLIMADRKDLHES